MPRKVRMGARAVAHVVAHLAGGCARGFETAKNSGAGSDDVMKPEEKGGTTLSVARPKDCEVFSFLGRFSMRRHAMAAVVLLMLVLAIRVRGGGGGSLGEHNGGGDGLRGAGQSGGEY